MYWIEQLPQRGQKALLRTIEAFGSRTTRSHEYKHCTLIDKLRRLRSDGQAEVKDFEKFLGKRTARASSEAAERRARADRR